MHKNKQQNWVTHKYFDIYGILYCPFKIAPQNSKNLQMVRYKWQLK